ncbi:Integrase family protein OS=Microvirga lotononidis GN=MicloDRAFT_00004820 PE=4 SV=1: HTH_29: DDE_3 [Gemmata massiliana]|uniref:Tc1-like transposase DDE domain-containing protein n=1 Tax=Gemmata massiliana TaxID=1210884 RepID=A0A6P2D3K9_9BACT|nr:transposase [Gemmata massiliana]VTR95673.1 Integrase family protein OS=Microvirga lotononidis GN=MicloDRAFT_00004820 PE=4 SV=1: HTH_29: DDE_3 [Gemmata massiliana]
MTRLPVVTHLAHDEIDRCYQSCSDAAEKARWHVLWLVTRPDQPVSAIVAARLVGFTPAWGRAILKRYNARGPEALADRRRNNGAGFKRPPQQAELFAALQKPLPDHELWSGRKVAAFVKDRFGVCQAPIEMSSRITGRNAKRVLFGAINPRTGHRRIIRCPSMPREDVRAFLRHLQSRYRDRTLWLILDRVPCHEAHPSQVLAGRLRIGLMWLPTQRPELNPVGHLWRELKRLVAANRQFRTIDEGALRRALVPRVDRTRIAPEGRSVSRGLLAQRFTCEGFCRPT